MYEGLILGIISWLSLIFSFTHFPPLVKKFLLKNIFLTDILATLICFFFLSSISQSIISVVGSITCGLLINITLFINNKINNIQNAKIKT